eukprot:Polyplicarium_translucidae@DN2361_c0_g1_i1.p1
MVVIGITGPLASGKRTAAWLIARHRLENGDGENERSFRFIDLDHLRRQCETGGEKAAEEVERYVLRHWRQNFVIASFRHPLEVEPFRKRPFVLLSVEAPLLSRFSFYQTGHPPDAAGCECAVSGADIFAVARTPKRPDLAENERLRDFTERCDALCFGGKSGCSGVSDCMKLAQARVVNDEGLDWLKTQLHVLAASRSNCMKRRVGAVVVKNSRIIATGYNGTPSNTLNCNDGGCERCNNPQKFEQGRALESCACIHAEMNALLEAGRERCVGSTLYVTMLPCLGCAKSVINAGISDIWYASEYDPTSGAKEYLSQSGVALEFYGDAELLSAVTFA